MVFVPVIVIVAVPVIPAPVTVIPFTSPTVVGTVTVLLPPLSEPFITSCGVKVSVPVPVFTSATAPVVASPTAMPVPNTRLIPVFAVIAKFCPAGVWRRTLTLFGTVLNGRVAEPNAAMTDPAGMPGPLTLMPATSPVVLFTVTKARVPVTVPVLAGIATYVPRRPKFSVAPKLSNCVVLAIPVVVLLTVTRLVVASTEVTAVTRVFDGMPVPVTAMPTVNVDAWATGRVKLDAPLPILAKKVCCEMVAVAGLLNVMVFGTATVPSAVTVVPAGMPGPLTYSPTARFVVFATVTAVDPLISAEFVFGRSATLKLAAVVALLMVKLVPFGLMDWIVDPTGMPGPLTACPSTRPDVLPTVITLEMPSVFAL